MILRYHGSIEGCGAFTQCTQADTVCIALAADAVVVHPQTYRVGFVNQLHTRRAGV